MLARPSPAACARDTLPTILVAVSTADTPFSLPRAIASVGCWRLQAQGLDDLDQLYAKGSGLRWGAGGEEGGVAGAERWWQSQAKVGAIAAMALVASLRRPPRLTRYTSDPLRLTRGQPMSRPSHPLLAPCSGVVVTYSGFLPAGLVLDRNSGTISGTPCAAVDGVAFRIVAASPAGSSTYNLAITVVVAETETGGGGGGGGGGGSNG